MVRRDDELADFQKPEAGDPTLEPIDMNTSVSPNGTVGSPEIGATSHETGSPGVGALGPDLPIRAPECPPLAGFLADFTFRARVGGILEGQVYLMGTDARDLWVPLPDGNRPAVGSMVSVRVQVAP